MYTGNVYIFFGVERDETKPQSHEESVYVLAFKSAECGYFFLCVRDNNDVALQVNIGLQYRLSQKS